MALACIVFDCDGIILDSVDVKTQAFGRVADPFGKEARKALVDYHTLHGGVSRYEKFAWLVRREKGRDITPDESRRMGEAFVAYCLEAVANAPLVPGFLDVAERWFGRVPLYVASGTPHEELVQVLTDRNLAPKFAGIYGTPPAKAALLQTIVHRDAKVDPKATVMVGDSQTDMDAALIVGTKFYGRGGYFANSPWPWHEDLTKLNDYLEELWQATL